MYVYLFQNNFFLFQVNEKLNIPKKTKLFVEQSSRERENGTLMHRVFQHDLFLLRLNTARAFVRALQTSSNPITTGWLIIDLIINNFWKHHTPCPCSRTATGMDGTIHTDLWKSETSREIKKSFQHHLNIFKNCIDFQN